MLSRLGLPCTTLILLLVGLVGQGWLFVPQTVGQDSSSTANAWPVSQELLSQVADLEQSPDFALAGWASTSRKLLQSLPELALSDPGSVKQVVARLAAQSQRLPALANSAGRKYRLDINQIQRLRYSLDRRVAVWNAVLAADASAPVASESPFRSASRGRITFGTLDRQWTEYFLLDEVRRQFNALNPDLGRQKQAARKTLARMYSPILKAEQVEFVKQAFDPRLISVIKEVASDPVDYRVLLQRMEQHESRPSGVTEYRLNDLYQDCVWSEQPDQQAIAHTLQTHYRNANVRLAVSGELINRLVPELPATRERVSERVMGAAVSGQSLVSNRLEVQLVPDPHQVHLRLQTMGTVHSNTVARRDGFAIENEGMARFQVFKKLAFGRDGMNVSERPVAYSSANQKVVGMRSRLDGVPVVGWMARRVASQKIQDQAPRTEQLVRNKVERAASDRMQEQVEHQLYEMRTRLYQNVLQPLLALDLEPEPVQMSTTPQQLVMRYRLAGRDQMAASTARPTDSRDSLLSGQVHESALNNAIMRLELNGNRFSAEELQAHLSKMLGTQRAGQEESKSHDAQFEFAHFDPIRVRLDDQKVTIRLNLKSLKIGEGNPWKKLSVSTSYVPRVEGGTIVLDQDQSGIRLKGKRLRFRDQVAIRTVFEVLFQSQYRVQALSPELVQKVGGQLAVTQLVVSDGWLGLSMDDLNRLPSPSAPARQADEKSGLRSRWNRR